MVINKSDCLTVRTLTGWFNYNSSHHLTLRLFSEIVILLTQLMTPFYF